MNALPRQPDDPGITDLDSSETFPVIFKPSQMGHQTAWLKDVMIGEIMPNGWGKIVNRAQARIDLPGVPQKLINTDNFMQAKRALVAAVRAWIPDAGLRI